MGTNKAKSDTLNKKKIEFDEKYSPSKIESKWQSKWEDDGVYQPDIKSAKKPFYNLMMFPYPSAEGMHVGNMYAFTGADVYGRFQRMLGNDVFEPIGLDGFGIHSENYAMKVGRHPVEQAKTSEKNFYRQMKNIGNGFDWTRTVETYKPEYYRWTQWLFIQLFKAGLAYRKKAPVNFCPSCKTVLSDEQAIEKSKIEEENISEEKIKVCERCDTPVEKRDLEQWFFRITKYADRLLSGLSRIDWDEKVKTAQVLWIGKSEGLIFTAPVKGSSLKIQTFSAHFEAFRADTFVVIAPDHPLLEKIIEDVPNKKEILDFSNKIVQKRKNEGMVEEKIPEGIFTGKYIVDPVGNGDLPIWVANYAIKEYGTGIVKCSAHDERDFAFAKKYGIKLKPVLFPKDTEEKKRVEDLEICFTDMINGYLTEPHEFTGKRAGDVRGEVIKYVIKHGLAEQKTNYHLRDWLISRQRYWGPPIPMVFCLKCDWQPVPEKDLPVELPYIKDFKPLGIHSTGSGQAVNSPLASHPEFYETHCPKCGGKAKRETDVSDTFLDSAWYFLRYVSTDIVSEAFDRDRVKKWLPVNMYIGGAEHSVLHLLYSRFITMVLHDLGFIDFEEPFIKFRAHGLIVKDGFKMSKSKGNVVVPDAYIKKFGVDTLRAYLMFMGPFSQGGDFRDTGIEGMHRFLKRVYNLFQKEFPISNFQFPISDERLRMMHETIAGVTEDLEKLHYNTAIAKLMSYYNFLVKQKAISEDEIDVYLRLLAPFAPYTTEELWQNRRKIEDVRLKNNNNFMSIHKHAWPTYDPQVMKDDTVTIVVQINGKMREIIKDQRSKIKDQRYAEKMAMESEKVRKYLEGKQIRKVIYVPGKVINFVVE